MMAHKILVLDNLEKTRTVWLPDFLNRVATGSHLELRELHTTNDVKKQIPDCYVIITATEMPFSEETVFSRMLPIELAPLTAPRPEYQLQVDLLNNFNGPWKGMLDDLEQVVCQLNSVTSVVAPTESRLADFSVFCNRIQAASFLKGDELMAGLGSLMSRQKRVLEENSPFVEVLLVLLRTQPDEMGRWMNISELFSRGQRAGSSHRLDWRWSSSQGLAKHINMLESQLIQHFGMSVRTSREAGRDVRQYRFEKTQLRMN